MGWWCRSVDVRVVFEAATLPSARSPRTAVHTPGMYRPGALLLGLPISATLFLAGCGTPGQAVQPPPAVDAAVPATPASLAAVAAEYVGEPASASENSNWAQAFGPRPLEAELLFGSTGEYDGDAVQVIVGKGLEIGRAHV